MSNFLIGYPVRTFWVLIVFLIAIGCTPSESTKTSPELAGWDGNVQQWGTLRDVMRGEVKEGKVRLSEVASKPHVFGIGAPDQLQGEILIADGVAWVAKVDDGDRVVTQRVSPEESAVLLAISEVPRWAEVAVEQDVAAEEFDGFVQKIIVDAGLGDLETVPFTIEGQFAVLNLHVLNGQCPFAEVTVETEGASPPHRTTLKDERGLLVGFYAENGAGRITHHSTCTHVHALVGTGDERMVGHVDAVALKAGAVVRIPIPIPLPSE